MFGGGDFPIHCGQGVVSSAMRVELAIGTPGDCPVAEASNHADGTASRVVRSTVTAGEGDVVEEFTLHDAASRSVDGLAEIARYDEGVRYRFRRPPELACICQRIEQAGHPVADVHGVDGTLHVAFHVPDVEELREIVQGLRDAFGQVRLRKISQIESDGREDLVEVDRGRLTDRQTDVLQTALEMGYFEYPKHSNAGEVAKALDISVSTLSEHLAAAQGKVLRAVLGDPEPRRSSSP